MVVHCSCAGRIDSGHGRIDRRYSLWHKNVVVTKDDDDHNTNTPHQSLWH